MGSCIDCGRKDESESGAYRCGLCIRKAESRSWEVEQQGHENLRIQNELLSIEKQKLYEQREFQRRILEQSISTQKAFEAGYERTFLEGEVRLGGKIYALNFLSPYITEELIQSYYEGAFSRLRELIGPYNDENVDSLIEQIGDIGHDLKEFITSKSVEIVKDLLESDQARSHLDYQKQYRVLRDGSDGKQYCVHAVEFKFKIYIYSDGKLYIDGIAPGDFCHHQISEVFDSCLDLVGIKNNINGNSQKVEKLKQIVARQNKQFQKNLRKMAGHASLFETFISYFLIGGFLGLLPGWLSGNWYVTVALGVIFGVARVVERIFKL
jgi:hypothetical protein